MPTRANQAELVAHYGEPTSRKAKSQVRTIRLLREHCVTSELITTQAHSSIAAKFVDAYTANCRALDEWPTSVQAYNIRKVAGTDRWSLHAWALAWDVFGGSDRIDELTGLRIPSKEWFNGMQARGFFAGQNFRKGPDSHHLEMPWKTWEFR